MRNFSVLFPHGLELSFAGRMFCGVMALCAGVVEPVVLILVSSVEGARAWGGLSREREWRIFARTKSQLGSVSSLLSGGGSGTSGSSARAIWWPWVQIAWAAPFSPSLAAHARTGGIMAMGLQGVHHGQSLLARCRAALVVARASPRLFNKGLGRCSDPCQLYASVIWTGSSHTDGEGFMSPGLHTHASLQRVHAARILPQSTFRALRARAPAPQSRSLPSSQLRYIRPPAPAGATDLKRTARQAFHPHPRVPAYIDADKGHVHMWNAALEIDDLW
ncbi:hypothetical protein B0H10DRAFT_2438364 [Mycena sp. CBHHK59/15]|nr:hypothetical protein B0H10DRAFT_2438364 [Mycena sp. CBHHK59/15]